MTVALEFCRCGCFFVVLVSGVWTTRTTTTTTTTWQGHVNVVDAWMPSSSCSTTTTTTTTTTRRILKTTPTTTSTCRRPMAFIFADLFQPPSYGTGNSGTTIKKEQEATKNVVQEAEETETNSAAAVQSLEDQKDELMEYQEAKAVAGSDVPSKEEEEETEGKEEKTTTPPPMNEAVVASVPTVSTDAAQRHYGVCKWFDDRKGFGFVSLVVNHDNDQEQEHQPPPQQDIFVHQTAIVKQGFRKLEPGEKVTLEIAYDDNGCSRAIHVVSESDKK